MNTHTRRRSIGLQTVLATVVVGVSLSACGSDSAKVQATTTSSGSTYEVVPDAQVTAGLKKVRSFAAVIESQAPNDTKAAEATFGELHEVWEEIEGTVRAKEKQQYLDLEDALGGIKLGVQEKKLDRVTSGVADLNSALDAYLSAHP